MLELVHLQIGYFHPPSFWPLSVDFTIWSTVKGEEEAALLLISHKINWCLEQILLKILYFITHQDDG